MESNIDRSEEKKEKAEGESVEGIVDLEVELINALEEIDNLKKKIKAPSPLIYVDVW